MFSVNTIEFIDQDLGEDFEAMGNEGEKNYLDIRRNPPEFIRVLDQEFEEDKISNFNLNLQKMNFLEFLQNKNCSFERKGDYLKKLNILFQKQNSDFDSIETCFFDYIPVKSQIIKSNSKFSKKYICNRLLDLLSLYQDNEESKTKIIQRYGLLDFTEDPILKLSYNEYQYIENSGQPSEYRKVKSAQDFLEEKRYDLYLLDLSVINR